MDDWDSVSSNMPPAHAAEPAQTAKPTRIVKIGILVGIIAIISGISGFGLYVGYKTIGSSKVRSNVTPTVQVTVSASVVSSAPTIFSVSQFLPIPNQEIVISGKGFGTQAPYTNATSNYLSVNDASDSNWQAGYGHDWVTMSVSVWTDNQIVITGFSGTYGTYGWVYHTGDTVVISIWNPQSGIGGTGAAQYSLVVAG
jgi:hypothetical protein